MRVVLSRPSLGVTFLPVPRSINGKTYAPVNLDRIAHWVEQGRLVSSPEKPITARELVMSGCIHNAHDGVKLLGNVRHLVVLFRLSA